MTRPPDRSTQAGPYVQTPALGDCIALNIGQPSPWLLPLEALSQAAATALGAGQDRSLLQYGAAAGYPAFREQLAGLLSTQLGRAVDPEALLVTGGNSQALTMLSQVLAAPGGQVVCEDPTYFLSRSIFEEHHLVVRGVPVDRDGLRVDILEQQLRSGVLSPAFVYCIPSFHNPTGVCLRADRAARLLKLADEHDFMVISDNPYCLLGFTGQRQDAFAAAYGNNHRLLELGSFSKILAPGLRLGWIEAAPALCRQIMSHGMLLSGGGINPLVSAIVEPILSSGADGGEPFLVSHLQSLRATFGERAEALAGALRHHLPEACFSDPSGGYYLWLDLGAGNSSVALLNKAREHGAGILPGPRCSIELDLSRFARLSFSFYRADELRLAAERLARAFRCSRQTARRSHS